MISRPWILALAMAASLAPACALAADATTGTAVADHATTAAADAKPTIKMVGPEALAGYPTDKCIVSDEKLGDHGKIVAVDYKGRTVLLCCKSCINEFNDNADRFVKKLDEQAAAKKAKDGKASQ